MNARAVSAIAEARRHQRYPSNTPIRIRRTDDSGEEFEGVCTDFSRGGLGATVKAVFRVGEVVEVRFIAPEYSDSGCYRARIMYRNRWYEYGMYLLR